MFDKLIDIFLEFIGYFKFWRVIPTNKMGVRLLLGKNPVVLKPGVHFIFPFEIHNVSTCIVKNEWYCTNVIHLTTTDNKTITVGPALSYNIIDPIKWLYEANDASSNIHEIIRLCTSDILTDCSWEECTKKPVWTKIKNKIKDKSKDLGIEVTDFGLIDLTLSRILITKF